MSSPRSSQYRTEALTVICVALGLLLAATWSQPQGSNAPTRSTRPAPVLAISPARVDTNKSLPAFSQFSQIAEQPIFRASRRPPQMERKAASSPQKPTVAPAPPVPAPSFALRGVIITPDLRIAIIQLPGSPKAVLLASGETAEGWTLSDVTAEKVTFNRGTQRIDLTFPVQSGSIRGVGR